MISGLSPLDIGLPAKFRSWRPNQLLGLRRGETSTRTYQAHSMPVGDGKSVFYVGDALLTADRACILTSTKALQKQLQDDFGIIGLMSMMGRNNYFCIDKDCRNCEEGQYHRCPPEDCTYEIDRNLMLQSSLVTTNYSYYTRSYRYGRGMGTFDLLILDEAHDAPDEVCAAMAIEIHYWEASKIGINLPRDGSTLDNWHDWASEAMLIITRHMDELKASMDVDKLTRGKPHISTIKEYRFWNSVSVRVAAVLEAVGDWAVERIGDGYRLEPIWAKDYAFQTLFPSIPRVMLTSATMVRKTTDLLGIDRTDLDFYEYNSSFPPERSPVYIYPATGASGKPLQVSYRMSDDDAVLWVAKMDNVIRYRLDRKGIIHSVSYERSRYIKSHSEFADRMIVPEKGSETAQCLERFYKSGPGTVLVSPAITTGIDLKFSLAEYNLIIKVPFLDTRGAVLTARTEQDKEYAPYITAQRIVQAAGRTMRAPDDQSECVAPDVRILTKDLNWVAASDLKVGDTLLAFDEHTRGRGKPRRWRWSTVIKAITRTMPRVRVVYEGGSIICTPNHPWLIFHPNKHTALWHRADELLQGHRLYKIIEPWETIQSRTAGWVSGIFDGEGCLALGCGRRNPFVSSICIVQNEGAVLDQITTEYTKNLDFRFKNIKNGGRKCQTLRLSGGQPEIMRFLGSIRPVRLLEKFIDCKNRGEVISQLYGKVRVLRVEKMTPGPITSLQTSTKTFVAEGFGAHNTFILDANITWFLKRHSDLFPSWFHRLIQRPTSAPRPPRPLNRIPETIPLFNPEDLLINS